MSDASLKQRLTEDMKSAMRNKEKERLGVIRMVLAAFKQKEVDEQVEVDDEMALAILTKMVKQRRDSIAQYTDAGRDDLADVEKAEVEVIQEYLPAALSEDDIKSLIDETISATGASSMADMGKVIGQLKGKVQGRADMGQVSAMVKAALAG